MLERELKFHVPAQQRSRLKARLRRLEAETIELHARYYDTAAQTLARAGIALRLRLEGEVWVQTMKLPGPDEVSRIEWNHTRPQASLDLSLYDDTHVEALMRSVAERLECRYVTHITRLRKELRSASGIVEVSYDEGAVLAGSVSLPVHELELEGVSGEASDLFALSREWLDEYRLVIDLRSKAARGDALAALRRNNAKVQVAGPDMTASGSKARRPAALSTEHVQRLAAAVRAGQPVLAPDVGIGEAYLQCANDCMSQIVRNSGFLAGLDGMRTTAEQRIDYVHQIRVGIRRLRACWQLFGKTAAYPEPLLAELKHYFGILGQARDLDVIENELLPRLIQAGMPPDTTQSMVEVSDHSGERASLAASPEFQQTLLDLLEHLVLYGDAVSGNPALRKPAAPLLCKRLNGWLDAIRRKAPSFLEAHWDERHRVRKRVKRLRYGMEFAQGTLDPTRLTPLRNALVSAQKALGQLNDLYVAAEYYRGAGARHPSAMFALGWLAATQAHEAQASHMALQALSGAGRFSPASTRSRKTKK